MLHDLRISVTAGAISAACIACPRTCSTTITTAWRFAQLRGNHPARTTIQGARRQKSASPAADAAARNLERLIAMLSEIGGLDQWRDYQRFGTSGQGARCETPASARDGEYWTRLTTACSAP
jgi:hypothetical protein